MGFPQESTRKPFGLVTNLPLQQADIKEISKKPFLKRNTKPIYNPKESI
jgi:hypothetical protein